MSIVRLKIVGVSMYGTPVLRVENTSNGKLELRLDGYGDQFEWRSTVPTGTTFIELPDTARYSCTTEQGTEIIGGPSKVLFARHEGPIHQRAHRRAGGIATGTTLRTLFGDIAVEDLRSGDPVLCRDNSFRSVRWIGKSRIDASDDLAPLSIRAGSLGAHGDLTVSPETLLRLEYGPSSPAVEANALIGTPGVASPMVGERDYYHVLLSEPHSVSVAGIWCDALDPPNALRLLDTRNRDDLVSVFPDLIENGRVPAEQALPAVVDTTVELADTA